MKPKSVTLILLALLCAGISRPVLADVVLDWNNAALAAIRTTRTSPPVASRSLAILHVAIFDAVNGIRRTHLSHAVAANVRASADEVAAASAAAHHVLTRLFPEASLVQQFNQLHAATLGPIPDRPPRRTGLAWGIRVAQEILERRTDDGSSDVMEAPPSPNIGDWLPTPTALAAFLLPQWAFVRPFGADASHQFRPAGPPSLTSDRWAADYNEVKQLGRATGSIRTPDQTEIALFWADGAGTETPPGHWNQIAQAVSRTFGKTLEENARLFALLNIAMADAGICAWDAKYTFNNWRPVTAIRFGELDGNRETAPDPNWSSLISTPPFPDYVSGHSTFSAAAAIVLALFFGTDDVAFVTGSDALPGVSRSFPSFTAAAEEAALSRIYGGIHFRFASEDGLTAGASIGEWTFAHCLRPRGNRSRR